MNREIKFRGKDLIHNEWIYGGLAEDKKGNAVILPKANWQKGGCVNKDTIGQFTGLYDTNGKEIYEGDILRFYFNGDEYIVHVVFNGKTGAWCVTFKGCTEADTTPLGLELSFCEYIGIEVIGNIHDNPELIKEK
ncbi:protein containing YopX domain protein [gut metagenome]|uniref:Protein containing YopX domain protein n=1 Tax=gut metagenome TaxID=749906 RepID=J9G1C4_9ZZZZ